MFYKKRIRGAFKMRTGDGLNHLQEQVNYCLKCWKEFVTLDDNERAVLQALKIKNRHYSKNKQFRYYYEE